MSYVISANEVKERINEIDVVIFDVRANLIDHTYGRVMYDRSHIPGAYFLDLENDLSGEVKKHGGNHPLPEIDSFINKIRSFGITNESKIILYDHGGEMFAARAWWLFRYFGHENVYLLDGGWNAWINSGFEVTNVIPSKRHGNFQPNVRHQTVVSMEEVKIRNHKTILIDSRSYERYIGKEEPLYDRAGHIPGAIHSNWEDVFTGDGLLKDPSALEAQFHRLRKNDQIIVSCGSGVSACANILALQQIGFENVKLYAGSFSDWISYPENKINQGEAP